MRKKLIKFLSLFIFNSIKRKEFIKRHDCSYLELAIFKKKYKIKGKNNKIIIVKNGVQRILPKFLQINGVDIKVEDDGTVTCAW